MPWPSARAISSERLLHGALDLGDVNLVDADPVGEGLLRPTSATPQPLHPRATRSMRRMTAVSCIPMAISSRGEDTGRPPDRSSAAVAERGTMRYPPALALSGDKTTRS